MKSLNKVMDGSTKRIVQVIHQEQCQVDSKFQMMTKTTGFYDWLNSGQMDTPSKQSRPTSCKPTSSKETVSKTSSPIKSSMS